MSNKWYYSIDGKQHGPVSSKELKKLVDAGRLSKDDKVTKEGAKAWKKASSVRGLFAEEESSPPPLPQSVPSSCAATANSQSSPALWNPWAASAWSVVFSWAFGAYLVAQNWKALGEPSRANRCMIWFYSLFGLLFLPILLPDKPSGGIGFGILIAWLHFEGAPQVKYVKRHLGNNYQRKPWGIPIAIGTCLLLLAFISIFATESSNGSHYPNTNTFQGNGATTQTGNPELTSLLGGNGPEVVDFVDNTSDYKGKKLTLGISPMNGLNDLRPLGLDAPFDNHVNFKGMIFGPSAKFIGTFDIVITIPPNLRVPNAGLADPLIVTFTCTEGSLQYGNIAESVERR